MLAVTTTLEPGLLIPWVGSFAGRLYPRISLPRRRGSLLGRVQPVNRRATGLDSLLS